MHFTSRSTNSWLPTSRASSHWRSARGYQRSSVPAILSAPEVSCPTGRTTPICSGARQTTWTRSARDEPRRHTSRAANEVRACCQSQDSQGAQSDDPRIVPAARRRGDRVMRRRDFIILLGGAVAWPLAARAQQPAKLPTIGYLGLGTLATESQRMAAFVQRMRELGWIE